MSPIIGVHGFNFDPKSDGNDPWKLFHEWSEMLDADVQGCAWYSSTPTIGGILRAWGNGYPTRYEHAYKKLAILAARQLADMVADTKGPVSIICHSLGSRVTLQMLGLVEPGKVDRILILDGAELQVEAQTAVKLAAFRWQARPAKVLNICVRHDRVLKDLGSWAGGQLGTCIGYGGLGATPRPAGWIDLFLDDLKVQAFALKKPREWALNAVDRLDPAGHWESYRIQSNWLLYRHFMQGDDLADFAALAA